MHVQYVIINDEFTSIVNTYAYRSYENLNINKKKKKNSTQTTQIEEHNLQQ